ncbi:MAG TPA: hypothetical protein VEY11_11840 [Pyrinomonadaceae bacterium]|nr:hypothetical protein [Pyrinomonadaceae bacterium]
MPMRPRKRRPAPHMSLRQTRVLRRTRKPKPRAPHLARASCALRDTPRAARTRRTHAPGDTPRADA